MLRQRLRARHSALALGGWGNPHRDPAAQVDYLLHPDFTAEFYLTQIVSHHQLPAVERFVNEAARRGVTWPGVFGVFLYRSSNEATLDRLRQFFPVPVDGVRADFAAGLSPEEICARTIRALRTLGINKVYVSNLGIQRPHLRYRNLLRSLA
jgi:hypothetical protein